MKLLLLLLGLTLGAQEVYLSLPASIDAALENPDRAARILAEVKRPSDPLIRQLETEIRGELRILGAERAAVQRMRQELIAKVRYLYFLAAGEDSASKRLLLRLNGLPEDVPVHADDSVYESLQQLLWNSGRRLAATARRNRADLRLPANAIRLAFQIQFELANHRFDSLDKDSPECVPALIELADLCAWIPERERLPFAVSPIRNSSEPVIVPETPSQLFNIFVTSFRLVDWSAY